VRRWVAAVVTVEGEPCVHMWPEGHACDADMRALVAMDPGRSAIVADGVDYVTASALAHREAEAS